MHRALLIVAACLAIVTAGAASWPAEADAKDWRIEAMDVILDVQPSGDVLVSEDVTFAFEGSFSYVSRVIPTGTLEDIDDVEVLQDGRPLPRGSEPGSYDVFTEGDAVVVQLAFSLTDTSATWTIRYRGRAAVAYYDDGDELVWHVFDADTPVPIDRVAVTVRLPGEVAGEDLEWAVDTGMNVTSTVTNPAPSTVKFEAQDFFPYNKYWIAVGFPKGIVEYTWTARRILAAVTPRAGFLMPIAALLGMLLVWLRRGRDDPANVFASYVAEPPSDLGPAAAGALIDERVDTRELFATLADLARRGYLELPQTRADKSTWQVRKLKSIEGLKGLDGFVAGRLFAAGDDKVKSPNLQQRLAQIDADIDDQLFGELVGRGYFATSPDSARRHWRRRAWNLVFLLAVVTVGLALMGVSGWGYFAVGSVVTVVIVYAFARVMPQRTRTGAAEQRKWEAFRNYLDDLNGFQDLTSAQETFERYLPYAIAFGVEKKWVRRFQGLTVPVPEWLGPVVGPEAYRRPTDEPAPSAAQGTGSAAGGVGGPDLGGLADRLSTVTLSSVSEGLFSGLDTFSNALLSAPSSTGSGSGAFGGGRVTGGGSGHRSSSRSFSSDSFSGGGSSSGGGGGFSSGGGGGGGFRAG